MTTCSQIVTFLTNPDMIHYSICMLTRPEHCFLTHHNLFFLETNCSWTCRKFDVNTQVSPSAGREWLHGPLVPAPAFLAHHPPVYPSCLDTMKRRLLAKQKGRKGNEPFLVHVLVLVLQLCSLFSPKEAQQIVRPPATAVFPPEVGDNPQMGESSVLCFRQAPLLPFCEGLFNLNITGLPDQILFISKSGSIPIYFWKSAFMK